MAIRIRVHYNGETIVPDEPVDLPVDQPIEAEFTVLSKEEAEWNPDEARAALKRIMSRAIHGLSIPDEALRRENMYEESL